MIIGEKNQIKNVAIVRIEQLFPLPVKSIKKLIDKYNAKDVVWAQEEPRNMGAWGHILMHLDFAKSFRVASRRFYSSPASGSAVGLKEDTSKSLTMYLMKKDNFKKLICDKSVNPKTIFSSILVILAFVFILCF